MGFCMPYDWKEASDRPDVFDRFTREPNYWPTPDDDESDSRGRRPFTQAELDDYFRRGGRIKYCPTPRPKRRRPKLSKSKEQWASEFDVTTGILDAVAVLKQHLEIIRPTSRRNRQKRERIRGVIKAALAGWTQADLAREWSLDPAIISRLIKDAYNEYPNFKRPLRQLNLLNLHAKRRELSSSWLCALQWGAGNSEQDEPLPTAAPYIYKPSTVKLLELYGRAFPQRASIWNAMVDAMSDEAVSVGTQRVLRTAKGWNNGYDEADRTDYRAGLWRDDYDHDAIDIWLRLRRSIDCADTFKEFILAFDGYPLDEHLAWFFHKEGLRCATIDGLPTRFGPRRGRPSTPWSLAWSSPFVGAPSSNQGDLGPTGREIPYRPVRAPIHTNYYTKGFRIPKKLRPLSKLRGKGPRSKLFASAVFNHGKSNINSELRKQFPEPSPKRLSANDWKTLERRMHEAKWSSRPMCNALRHMPLPSVRADELISGWPILMASMRRDSTVLFVQQVTPSTPETIT